MSIELNYPEFGVIKIRIRDISHTVKYSNVFLLVIHLPICPLLLFYKKE